MKHILGLAALGAVAGYGAGRGGRARTRGERRGLTEKHRAKMIRTFAIRRGLTPRQVEEELKQHERSFRLNLESGEWRGVHTESELRRALESMLAHGPSQREYRRKSKRSALRRRRKEEKHRGRRDWAGDDYDGREKFQKELREDILAYAHYFVRKDPRLNAREVTARAIDRVETSRGYALRQYARAHEADLIKEVQKLKKKGSSARGRRATTDWFYRVSHKAPRGKGRHHDFRTGIVAVPRQATQQEIRTAIHADAAKHGSGWSIVGYGPARGRRAKAPGKLWKRIKGVRIYRDLEWDQYVVAPDLTHEAGWYHTDDREDAVQTAGWIAQNEPHAVKP